MCWGLGWPGARRLRELVDCTSVGRSHGDRQRNSGGRVNMIRVRRMISSAGCEQSSRLTIAPRAASQQAILVGRAH